MRRYRGLPIVLAIIASSPLTAFANVDPLGGFVTNVPIDVPPYRSLTPKVGLGYSSNGGNGFVGVGWRLEGFSAIERGQPRHAVPRYQSDDVFVLDGVELVTCAGNSPGCAHGGTHATHAESFQRITYDSQNDDWTVWAKDGTRSHYRSLIRRPGTTTTFRWALDRVTDTHGNSVAYTYSCLNALECYPNAITYAPGVSCGFSDAPIGDKVPGATIQMWWEPRSDTISYAIGGGLAKTTRRLASIEVRMHQGRLSVYDIQYGVSSSNGASIITSVQRFGTDAALNANGRVISGTAMPQARYTTPSTSVPRGDWYGDSGSGGSTNTLPWDAAPYNEAAFSGNTPQIQPTAGSTPAQIRIADVNGDGRDDTIIVSVREDTTTGFVHQVLGTALSTPTGYSFRTFDPDPAGNTQDLGIHEDFLTGDATGDGKADIIQIRNDAVLEVWESIGDGTYTRSVSQPVPWPLTMAMPSTFTFAASVGATIAPFTAAWSFHFFSFVDLELEEQYFVADINGDLRVDFVQVGHDMMNDVAILRVALSTGTGFDLLPDFVTPWRWTDTNTRKNRFFPGDLNGDGRTDIIHIGRHEAGLPGDLTVEHATIEVGLSMGDGTFTLTGEHNGSLWNDDDQWFPGDFDGDAKTDIGHVTRMAPHTHHPKDHVLFRAARSNGMGGFTWTTADTNFPWWRTSPCLDFQLYPNTFLAADFNGDSRSDLSVMWEPTGDCNTTTMNVAVAFSRPNDTWQLEPNFRVMTRGWSMKDDIGVYLADVNGDHRADVVTSRWKFPTSDTPITLDTLLSPNVGEDYQNWTPAELDGDGRTDFVYVYFMNPGYRISTLRRTASGFVRVESFILPDSSMPGLDDADTSSWMVADVGSPAGSPDGRVDLVQFDRSRWRINTLLSLDNGTFSKVSSLPYPSSPPLVRDFNWRLMDVDGDDRADLVNVEPMRPGVLIRTLVSTGTGVYIPRDSVHFTNTNQSPFGIYDDVAGFTWRTTDVDDDGRADLTLSARHFDGATLASLVRTLVSTGTGWEERVWRGGTAFPDAWRWTPLELNGDGANDLAYVDGAPSGPVLYTLTSLGDGSFEPAIQSFPLTDPWVHWVDAQTFRPIDFDRDGKSELVHVGTTRNAFNIFVVSTVVLWNRGGSFRVEARPSLTMWGADSAHTRLADGNGDGRPDIVLPHYGIKSLSVYLPSNRLGDVDNGMGGMTSIAYKTSAGAHTFVPPGALFDVVSMVTVQDTISPSSTAHTTSYTLEGARWSTRERRMLGFATTTARDTHTVRTAGYELSENCGARPSYSVLADTFGTVIQQTQTKYVSSGTVAPYLCLTRASTQSECEGEPVCRDTAIEYTYDFDTGVGDFGNVVTVDELGDVADREDDRRIYTTANPNTADWLTGFTATREIYGIVNGSWDLESSVRYGYDGQSYTAAPSSTGDMTSISTWDDVHGTYFDSYASYDRYGNTETVNEPVTRWNAKGRLTRFKYDCTFSLHPTTVCDDLYCRDIDWNLTLSKPSGEVDRNGGITTVIYDELGRTIQTFVPDGGESRVEYPRDVDWGTRAQHVRESQVDGSRGDGVLWKEQYFDGLGRVTTMVLEGGRARDNVYFEATDLIARTSGAYLLGQTPPHWTRIGYDAAHRPVTVTLPDGATQNYIHTLGQLRVRDPAGNSKLYMSDGFGRVREIREELRHCSSPENCSSKWTSTRYVYDTAGHVHRVIDDAGNVTVMDWSSRGSIVKSCDPDRGCEQLSYDEANLVEQSTDAQGQVIAREYDVLGRPAHVYYHDNGGGQQRHVTYWYDVDPATGQPSGASIGRTTGFDDNTTTADGSERYTYDPMGRIARTAKCADRACYAWEHTFDIAGRLQDVIYPDGEVVTNTYNDEGFLRHVGRYVRDVDYDLEGRAEVITYGNGAIARNEYDSQRNWLNAAVVEDAFGGPVFEARHTHDRVGRPDTSTVMNHQAVDFVYGYDSLNRLTSVTASDQRYDEMVDYDNIGNITANQRNGGYLYDDPAHVHAVTRTGVDQYKYDDSGNLLASGVLEIAWTVDHRPSDVQNRITGARVLLDYDPAGNRVKKSSANGTRYWLGKLVEEDANGKLVKNYFMGEQRVARDNGQALTYFHTDHVGNVRLTTDDNGMVQNRYDYSAFGEIVDRTEVIDNDFELAGRDSDDETGLVYMGSRYYDPTVAKFVSADTIVPDVLNPQAYNRYSYVYNDPISFTDPSGHGPYYQSVVTYDPATPTWPKVVLVAPAAKPEPTPTPRARPVAAPKAPAPRLPTTPGLSAPPLVPVENASPSAPPLVQADAVYNPDFDQAKLDATWADRREHPRYDVMRDAEAVVAVGIMAPVLVFVGLEAAPASALVAIGDYGALAGGIVGEGASYLLSSAAHGVSMIASQSTLTAGILGAGAESWGQIYHKGMSDTYDYNAIALAGAFNALSFRIGGIMHGKGAALSWVPNAPLGSNMLRFAIAQPIWLAYGRGVGFLNSYLRNIPMGPQTDAQLCSTAASSGRALGWSLFFSTPFGQRVMPNTFKDPLVVGINTIAGNAQWQTCAALTGASTK